MKQTNEDDSGAATDREMTGNAEKATDNRELHTLVDGLVRMCQKPCVCGTTYRRHLMDCCPNPECKRPSVVIGALTKLNSDRRHLVERALVLRLPSPKAAPAAKPTPKVAAAKPTPKPSRYRGIR